MKIWKVNKRDNTHVKNRRKKKEEISWKSPSFILTYQYLAGRGLGFSHGL
jgi:hypothetical protein